MDTHEPATPEYLALSEAAHVAGRSVSTMRRALRDPVRPLPHLRIGLGDPKWRRVVIRRADLIEWVEGFAASAEAAAQ